MNARYYDADLGAFLSVDPIARPTQPPALNPYSYGVNNPVTFTDATGLSPKGPSPGMFRHIMSPFKALAYRAMAMVTKNHRRILQESTTSRVLRGGLGRRTSRWWDGKCVAIANPGCDNSGNQRWAGNVLAGAGNALTLGQGVDLTARAMGRGGNFTGRYADTGSYAYLGGEIGGAAFGIWFGAASAADDAARVATQSTEALSARANEIHGALDPIAQNSRTTAVMSTREGPNIIAGGGRDLSPAQRALANEGEILGKLPGAHAEVTAMDAAAKAGLTPAEIAASRPICPPCQQAIEASGGHVAPSGWTAWWP
jgi:hypothetical protein